MITTPKLKIPKWAPPAAGEKILEWWNRPASTPEQLAVLRRLAKHNLMRDVWQKLPPAAARREGEIVAWTIIGQRMAAAVAMPIPSRPTNEQVREYLQKHKRPFAATASAATVARSLFLEMKLKRQFPTTAQTAAITARSLLDVMREIRQNAEVCWGNGPVTYSQALDFVATLAQVFELMWEEEKAQAARNQVAGLVFPDTRKKWAADTPQISFTKMLSKLFKSQFGRPCDDIVSDLVAVAMGLEAGPSAPTTRGRRRSGTPAHSRKGTR
jgi:hypothetical protein